MKVGGNVTRNQLWLHLSINGPDRNTNYTNEQGVDLDRLDDLFLPAAQKVLELAAPYMLAAYLDDRQPSKSLQLAQRIIKDRLEQDDHVIAATQVLIGQFLLLQNKIDDATHEFSQAIKLDHDDPDAHINFGTALQRQGMTGEARKAFQMAIDALRKASNSDPRSASAHADLGLALLTIEENKPSDARAELETAIKLDPNDSDTHANLGIVGLVENKLEDAIAELRKAIDLDPRSVLPHLWLGTALGRHDQRDE